jgi:hypothetical protein
MNSINKIFLVSALSIALISCGDQLDIEPKDTVKEENAIRTSADVEALVVAGYDRLANGDLLGGNILRNSELLGDDGEIFWDGTFVAPGEIWSKSILLTNDQAEGAWLAAYETINTCNNALDNLGLVVDVKKDQVEGEAKFIRGVAYFELILFYARTWVDGDPTVNPGVPLILEPTTLENAANKVGRSTVSVIYNQIISDLTDAENLLPEENGFYATTYAASAVLSRVYLQQNDFVQARDRADRVIGSGLYELNGKFSDSFNRTSIKGSNASTEDVFAIQVTTQDGINNMNTFFADADYGGRNDVYVEDAHFDIYEAGDVRGNMFYFDNYTSKFNNQFGNITYIRLAEMYLTRAETNFTLGTAIGADPADDLNLIRNRAGVSDLPGAITLDEILLERRRELAFEGQKLHDYKRTKRDVGDLAFDAPQLIFPIPLRERNINLDLEQNFGY